VVAILRGQHQAKTDWICLCGAEAEAEAGVTFLSYTYSFMPSNFDKAFKHGAMNQHSNAFLSCPLLPIPASAPRSHCPVVLASLSRLAV